MKNIFESKIRYQKINEQGKVKNATETYLLDAVSFTDAEERINREMEPYISGDFTVLSIKLTGYSETIHGQGDIWFKCLVSFISIDEEKGMERKVKTPVLVRSGSAQDAINEVDQLFLGSVTDYEITSVQETAIIEYFVSENETMPTETEWSEEEEGDFE